MPGQYTDEVRVPGKIALVTGAARGSAGPVHLHLQHREQISHWDLKMYRQTADWLRKSKRWAERPFHSRWM